MIRYYTIYGRNFKFFSKAVGNLFVILASLLIFISDNADGLAQESYVLVEYIEISGNKNFSEDEITGLLNVNIPSRINRVRIEEWLEDVAELYRQNGYFFFEVDTLLMISSGNGRQSTLTMAINEGSYCLFGSYDLTRSSDIEIEEIKQYLPQTGTPFNTDLLKAALTDAGNRFANEGFPYLVINIEDIDFISSAEEHAVDAKITLDIKMNEPVTIDSVAVYGNEYTKDYVLLRECRLKAGDVFDQGKLEKARDYLEKLPYIESVGEPALYTMKDKRSMVHFPVTESNANFFDGVIGYVPSQNEENGYFVGSFHVDIGNILGTGRRFEAEWTRPDRTSQNLKTLYEEPWIGGLPVDAFGSFEQNVQDSSFVKRTFIFGTEARIMSNLTAQLSFGIEQVIADDTGRAVFGLENSRSSFYSFGISYLNMDNPLNPGKGIYYTTLVSEQFRKITGDEAADNNSYKDRKVNARIEAAVPLKSKFVLFSRAAWDQTFNSKNDIPVSQQWYLGGVASLRGYREKQFLAGTVSWYNLELRYLLDKNSRIFLFNDGGFFHNKGEDVRRKFGYGFGMRISSRIGMIGFDIGLGEGDTFSTAKLHVQVRNSF